MFAFIFLLATVNAMTFNEWKALHKKSYNAAENLRRKFIYQTNSKYVEAKNKEFSYKLSMNGPFAAMTQDEFKQMTKGVKEQYDEVITLDEFNKQHKNVKQASSYGSYIDYRNRLGKNQVTPVGDQGTCDSGYVFAASSLIESKMLITYSSLSASTYGVSKGELLCCTKGYDGSNNDGCNGGSVVTLLKYAKAPLLLSQGITTLTLIFFKFSS